MTTPHPYLDFERPIADLESKIEELSALSGPADPSSSDGAGAFDSEIASLRARVEAMRAETYAGLDAWQKTQVARHPLRPHLVDYIGALIEDFVELKGDRAFGDDQAMIGGLGKFRGIAVALIGQEKGHDTASRLKHNFGMGSP